MDSHKENTKWQLEQRGDLETTESLGDVQVWDTTGPSGRKVRLVNIAVSHVLVLIP